MSYPQNPRGPMGGKGPGNGSPFGNPFNRNNDDDPGNKNNKGDGRKPDGGKKPIWQSPLFWTVLLVILVMAGFQIFSGTGTQTIDTKDGMAMIVASAKSDTSAKSDKKDKSDKDGKPDKDKSDTKDGAKGDDAGQADQPGKATPAKVLAVAKAGADGKTPKVTRARIVDNKQLVKLKLESNFHKADSKTGNDHDYGRDVQFYYTYAEGPEVLKAVQQADLPDGWTADRESDGMVGYLLSLLPFVFIFALGWWFLSRINSSAGSMFGMGGGKKNGKLLEGQTPTTKFKDVAGEQAAVAEVEEIKDFLKDPSKYKALGARIPRGVLLYGPPGTGKTLLARAIAGEASVPFYAMAGSDFVEMFVGLGASRVRDLFEEAKKNAPAIIFIDEIDAVGRKRGSGMNGGHDEREQTLNQLLVEMDGFDNDTNLIIIAATNRPDVLDSALLRPGRFDRQVAVEAPDLEGREAILKVHAKGKPFVPDVDLHTVAVRTPGFTGADLANVLNEAALLCARAGAQLIDDRAIDEAIDRVQAGPKRQSRGMALDEMRNTAYHEGGHALVAAAMHHTDPVTKVTILPRGRALGYTAVMPTQDRYSQSRFQLLDQMAYAMGGRTAEEVVFHDPTTGASNDIEKATQIARQMVMEFGLSSSLGAVKWGNAQHESDSADNFIHDYSERTGDKIDEEVQRLIETAHTEAWKVITENRDILDELVRQLLVKETLNEKELAAIFAPMHKAPERQQWLSDQARPVSQLPPVPIPESLKRSVGMKPEE